MPGTGNHYDVLLRNGEVIDPAQKQRGIRDVAIANGRIVLVEEDLAWVQADQTLDVAGKVVVPGLIDLHTHVCAGVTIFGMEADDLKIHN
jgi:dihydroorotase